MAPCSSCSGARRTASRTSAGCVSRSEPMRAVSVRANVGVAARDGTRLSTDLYLPPSPTPVPTVLIRTPYDNTLPFLVEKGRRLADHGYAVAIQDCRGRFDSDGAYDPFRNEGRDGFDTVEWLAAQPW